MPNDLEMYFDELLGRREGVPLNMEIFLLDGRNNKMKIQLKEQEQKEERPYIWQMYGLRPKKGMFGIEIECEGEGLNDIAAPNSWKKEVDRSLRGESAEFILIAPLDRDKAIKSLNLLKKKTENIKFKFSYRTSVHIHLNISNLSRNQIENVVYVSHLLESALVNYSGETRIGNRFCLRSFDAEYQINHIKNLFASALVPDKQDCKYAAINLAPICVYGSLEFRMFPGTLDVEYLSNILEVLENLFNYAISFNNTLEIYNSILSKPIEDLFKTIDTKGVLKYKGMVDDLRNHLSLLVELPYTRKYE